MNNQQSKCKRHRNHRRQEENHPYLPQEDSKNEEGTNEENRTKEMQEIEAKISQLKSKISNQQYKLVQPHKSLEQQEQLSQKQQRKYQREEKKKLLQEKRQQLQKLKELRDIVKEQRKQEREEKKNLKKEEKQKHKCQHHKQLSNEQSSSIIKQKEQIDNGECPQYLLCPINQTQMRSPYLLSVCGHTFQEQVIRQWLTKQQKCPLCNKPAQIDHLVKNYALAQVISSLN